MAQIHLRYGYRGHMSNEKFIPAGTYDDHDPALMGIVAYLVKNGHATVIESKPAVDDEHEDELPIFVNGVGFVDEPPDITFTDGALKVLKDNGIDPDDTLAHWESEGVERVTFTHAKPYVESLS